MASVSPYILVGCGGSGIKTLIRINEMLAGDPAYRSRIGEEIYYLAIDTNMGDLDEFRNTIIHQLAGIENLPLVETIELSSDIQLLTPLVNEYFQRRIANLPAKEQEIAKARLMEHWWFAKGDFNRPFTAPHVSPLTKGAGQCPLVSHFLAWRALSSDLGNSLDRIIRRVRKNLADEAKGKDALTQATMVLAASLAGGTGRGCWEMVCFKMRQMVSRGGTGIRPVTFFFDATVFDSEPWANDKQKTAMRVNSLTGISQLSAWLRNTRVTEDDAEEAEVGAYRYKLPNLEKPADPRTDVIDVELMLGTDDAALAPVHSTYLIFNQSPGVLLGSADQYYRMLGTGVYTLMRSADAAGSLMNDTANAYGSIAAASFEVPAAKIREFMESRAHWLALNSLVDPERRDNVALAKAVENIRKNYDLPDEKKLRMELKAKADGTVLQKLCQTVIDKTKTVRDAVIAAMSDQDEDTARDNIENCMKSALVGTSAEESKLLSEWTKRFEEDVRTELDKLVAIPRKGVVNSVKAIHHDFLAPIKAMLAKAESYADEYRFALDTEDDPVILLKKYARRIIPIGDRFQDEEIADMGQKLPSAILVWNYVGIVKSLKAIYAVASSTVERMMKDLERFMNSADTLAAKFKTKANVESVFTDADAPSKSIPGVNSAELRIARVLKPVVERRKIKDQELGHNASVDAMVLDALSWSDEFQQFLKKTFIAPLGTGDDMLCPASTPTRKATWAMYRDELEEQLMVSAVIEDDFIEDNFRFDKVLDGFRLACEQELNRIRAKRDRAEALERKLEGFFGVRPVKEGGEYRLPGPEDLMEKMVASLVSTCRPFWITMSNSFTVDVFMPVEMDDARREKFEDRAIADCGCKVSISAKKGEITKLNPFCIMIMATAYESDIDNIRSLQYWRDDADVLGWLELCEDEGGKSVFLAKDDFKGVGYNSPIFVRSPELKTRRWKPWVPTEDIGATEKALNDVYDAIIYGLLELDEEDSAIAEGIAEKGWSLPLIKDVGREKFVFTRGALRWDGVKKKAKPAPDSWDDGQEICSSIWQVVKVLSGQGNTQNKKVEVGAKWRERILKERDEFYAKVLGPIGAGPGTDPYHDMMSRQQQRFIRLMNSATGAPRGLPEQDDKATWKRLAGRIDKLLEDANG